MICTAPFKISAKATQGEKINTSLVGHLYVLSVSVHTAHIKSSNLEMGLIKETECI